ncbi:hypothetical protein VC83_02532 [Pseudogymnoascus destructans]|uniref:Uncharacterized protein n=1 Tax=Pseudogymnoascus destructans TaxID=655981 RepID=A0A177AJ43_9PEZI|nr:uncharacterized protein VC83_02532 [Pseudogymnoascus destructans]OAF61194.1 hypothetical protein VC83_02532 [Pseudogymnoascus destructans]
MPEVRFQPSRCLVRLDGMFGYLFRAMKSHGRIYGMAISLNRRPSHMMGIVRTGRTPLSYAAGNGDLSSLNLLLREGANVDSKDSAAGRRYHMPLRMGMRASLISYYSLIDIPLPPFHAEGNRLKGGPKLILRCRAVHVNIQDKAGRRYRMPLETVMRAASSVYSRGPTLTSTQKTRLATLRYRMLL